MKKIFATVAFSALIAGSGYAIAAGGNAAGGNASGGSTIQFNLGYACTVNGDTNPFTGTFDLSDKSIVAPDLMVIPNVDLGSVVTPNLSVACTGQGAKLSAKTQNGGITLNGVAANTNVPRIHYKAVVKVDNLVSVTLLANGTPGKKTASAGQAPFTAAALTGTASTLASPYPLQAGAYSDVMTIQVGDPL